jgi:hypothetical protein
MPSRLLNSIVFAGIFAIGVSSAQEGIAEVPIPQDAYGEIISCGADGQAFFHLNYAALRLSLDGSSLTFKLPDKANVRAVAPYAAGVNILGRSQEPKTFIYHFDNDGKLIAQHPVTSDLDDIMMATTSSGITILVGHHIDKDGESGYGGLVLDAGDRVVSRFELPPPPDGGAWNFGEWNSLSDHLLMTAGDRAVYVLLHASEPLATEIAMISESGKLSVRTLEPISDGRQYTKWLVGPGVVVEMYHMAGDRRRMDRHLIWSFDEYDLKSGKRIASKIAPMGEFTPFTAACYYGDTVTGVGGVGARQVAPDEPHLRLRIAKLQ